MNLGVELPWFIRDPQLAISKFKSSLNYLVIDFETTNKNKGSASEDENYIVYGYIYSPTFGSFDINGMEDVKGLEWLFNSVDFVVAHNAKFEIKWLQRCGIRTNEILFYCTFLGDWVRSGNRAWRLSLEDVSRRYGGSGKDSFVSLLIKSGICPSTIPRTPLRQYCAQDVHATYYVFQRQRKCLADEGLLAVQYLRCIVCPLLADMEMMGVHLDKDLVVRQYEEDVGRYNKILRELDGITGGINMASGAQVATFIYGELGFEELRDKRGNPIRNKPTKQFPQGLPKTDEETIEKLKATTKEQRRFLELKKEESKLRKKISSYLERFMYACGAPYTPMKEGVDLDKKYEGITRGSCIIHGNFNQGITDTHRLSASKPNLQNVDRTLKQSINSRYEGWNIFSADYKTIEMTAAGLLAQDKQCLTDIRNKHDFHKFTASTFLDKPMDAITKDERQEYKPSTFRPLYYGKGQTAKTKKYFDDFRARYPDIAAMQDKWINEVLMTKKLVTVTGLVYYWPNANYTGNQGYVEGSTEICNYPIQGFATGEIAPAGTVILWHYLKALHLKSFLIIMVHDSVVVEECPDERELLQELTVKALTVDIIPFFKQVINYDINFPIEVELDSFKHWDGTNDEKEEAKRKAA